MFFVIRLKCELLLKQLELKFLTLTTMRIKRDLLLMQKHSQRARDR